MSITELGALGEFVSAIGVIATLLYLAVQIRQNTQMVQGSTIQAVTETIERENHRSCELAETFVKAVKDKGSLSDVDVFRLGEWLTSAMSARQNEYLQNNGKLLDEEMWAASLGIIRTIMSVEFCRWWWESFDKSVYSPGTIVDDIVRTFVLGVEIRRAPAIAG